MSYEGNKSINLSENKDLSGLAKSFHPSHKSSHNPNSHPDKLSTEAQAVSLCPFQPLSHVSDCKLQFQSTDTQESNRNQNPSSEQLSIESQAVSVASLLAILDRISLS